MDPRPSVVNPPPPTTWSQQPTGIKLLILGAPFAIFIVLLIVGALYNPTPTPVDEGVTGRTGQIWTYTASDGTLHTVPEDDDSSFTDGKPGPVHLMDTVRPDFACYTIRDQLALWTRSATDSQYSPDYRNNATAYAAYARDRLARLGC